MSSSMAQARWVVAPVAFRSCALLAAVTIGLLAGCDEDGGGPPEKEAPRPPLAEYLECVSTVPVDSGDPDRPVITLNGPRVIDHALGTPYVDQGATALDPQDGDLGGQLRVTGLTDLDSKVAGDYLVRFNVTDSAHLAATEVVRLVRVNAGTFPAQTARATGTTGAHLGYYEHLPRDYAADSSQKFPLIIFIHGWGNARFLDPQTLQAPLSILENENLVRLMKDGAWDDALPFIVLSPQKCYDQLVFGETAARMKRFIDYAISTYKVDTSRLYLGGHSQGSGDTWDYVVNYPEQLAAVVPISGGYGAVSGCALKDTPAWAFIGELDATVSYRLQVATVNSINACHPAEPARVTVLPGVHHNDIQAPVLGVTGLGGGLSQYSPYDQNIYDWLLQHRRP